MKPKKAKRKGKEKLPDFDRMTDEEVAHFWDTHSFADYWEEFERLEGPVFVRPPKKVISLRLDRETVSLLEMIAQEKAIPIPP